MECSGRNADNATARIPIVCSSTYDDLPLNRDAS